MKTLVETGHPFKDWKEVEEAGIEELEAELPADFIWSLFRNMKRDLDVKLLGDASGVYGSR